VDVAVLGNMGRAMAGRLLDGAHQLAVRNRSTGKAGPLVSAGARQGDSVTDAVHAVDVAITMLANDGAVRAVALRDPRSSIPDQTVYADCSTVSPGLSGALAEAYPSRFLAMPVLSGPAAARSGQTTYLAGGDGRVVHRIGAVLASLSSTVRRYDSPPLAGAAKLTSNLLLLSGIVGLAEAFAVGRCGGLSDDQLRDLLGGCPLVAPGLSNRFEAILTGGQDGRTQADDAVTEFHGSPATSPAGNPGALTRACTGSCETQPT
jgi:3-hydroxyisobutyrate dehydrogenase-like beta-hydroxyacid dehydrogenase